MGKKIRPLSRRAWRLLRMGLLWARKGGALRRGLMMELRLLPNYIKRLRQEHSGASIYYREKEFSFDETPMFNFKVHRPLSLRFHMPSLPCIKPQVDFEYEFSGDDEDSTDCYQEEAWKSYLTKESHDDERINSEVIPVAYEGVDLKAEEFIENFHRQMKIQRQISYLRYDEMLSRGTN